MRSCFTSIFAAGRYDMGSEVSPSDCREAPPDCVATPYQNITVTSGQHAHPHRSAIVKPEAGQRDGLIVGLV